VGVVKLKSKTMRRRKFLLDLQAFKRGVKAAAGVVEMFTGSTTHPYRLDDVVLCKLNVVSRDKPRLNKKALEDPREVGDAAWVTGFALALAEVHRLGAGSSAVCEVARDAGITLATVKECGADPYDWRELKKAGVK
jgi:hypothetical protein